MKTNFFIDIILIDIGDEVDAHGILLGKTDWGRGGGEDIGYRRRFSYRRWSRLGGLWTPGGCL